MRRTVCALLIGTSALLGVGEWPQGPCITRKVILQIPRPKMPKMQGDKYLHLTPWTQEAISKKENIKAQKEDNKCPKETME